MPLVAPFRLVNKARNKTLAAGRRLFNRVFFDPHDLGSQLEDLFVEVLRQEKFELQHPFTCAAMRAAGRLALRRRSSRP